jgi:hypothetical protein
MSLRIIKETKIVKKHKCNFCNRLFTRKTTYEKHILTCEQLQKSKYLINIEEEENNNTIIPSKLQMMKLIENLILDVNYLKDEITQLKEFKKFVEKTKKQLSIIDWLNDPKYNNIINIDFFDTINKYNIEYDDMMYILNNDYIDGIYSIFQKIFNIENTNNHSIRCYQHYNNCFFISLKNTDNSFYWKKLNLTDIKKALKIIDKKLWIIFIEYKKQNQQEINKSDFLYEKFVDYNKKISGYSKTPEKNITEILDLLFKYLKRKFTNIIEYETSF